MGQLGWLRACTPMRLSFFCAAGVGLTFVYGLLMGVLHECFGGLLVPVLAGGLKQLSRTPHFVQVLSGAIWKD